MAHTAEIFEEDVECPTCGENSDLQFMYGGLLGWTFWCKTCMSVVKVVKE